MTQFTYEMQTRQQTSLTPRLQQSVKLLQMSTLDFNREVAEAIAGNPFLEDMTEEMYSPGQPRVALSSNMASYPNAHGQDYVYNDIERWARSQLNLQDALRANLCGYKLNTRERCLTELIIDALDSDGYLRTAFSDLADAEQFSPAVSDSEWIIALKLVQQLGAAGLGARNLSECLCLQLNALPEQTPYRELAVRIASSGLEKLGRCDYGGLILLTACDEDEVKRACSLIRSLDPRPGACFMPTDASNYIVADANVCWVGKLWIAIPNQDATRQVQLNHTYAKLFRQSLGSDRPLMALALREARWLVRSLEQRGITIQRVAQAIVARQQAFFDYGAIALRPLMLSEIADELGLHESTISRATAHKYLATPRGIFEFKYFFSRELTTRSGGTCSARAVRALIQEMIAEENPQEPLSDVALADKLASAGVIVARRTVSKYRTQIKYPAAELRRSP